MKLTTACQTVAVPEPSELAVHYYRSGNVLWAVSTGLSLLIPALLLFTGLSARLRRLAQGASRRWILMVALYALLFTLVTALLTLPLSYYGEYVRQHAYGLSNQSLGKWLGRVAERRGGQRARPGAGALDPLPAAAPKPEALVAVRRPGEPSRWPLSSWWSPQSGWTRSSTTLAP